MSPSSYFTAVDAVIVMNISSGDDDWLELTMVVGEGR
jgi:hypothetical protein